MANDERQQQGGFDYKVSSSAKPVEVPEKCRQEVAQLLYDNEATDYVEHLRLQGSVGLAAVRALFILNGGAVVALLTFIGNADHNFVFKGLQIAMKLFVGGLVAASLAPMAGYLAQIKFQGAAFRTMLDFVRHKIGNEPANDHKTLSTDGQTFLGVGLICAILSLVLFLAGALKAIDSITVG